MSTGRGLKVQPLGVGLPYFSALPAEFYREALLDFVEITPETLCRQRRTGATTAIDLIPEKLEQAKRTCESVPIVVHGVELSIGSAHGWNDAYIEMLDAFHSQWPFAWHSEHLSYQTIPGESGLALETGVPLPLPATREAAQLVAERSAAILKRYGVPFLLENPAHYLPDLPVELEIGNEGGLMREITERSNCGQLLDLHNVYCNAVNHGGDPIAMIDSMPLDRVVEIHIAGGSSHDGFLMDAHDGRVDENVWELLDYTIPRTPNLGGIVFEMLDMHAASLGTDAIAGELSRMRTAWRRLRG